MTSINSLSSPLFDPSISRALIPVQPSAQGGDGARDPARPQQAPVRVTLGGDARLDLLSRAELLQQRTLGDDALNSKNRQAIRAYRALSESEEREAVSSMFGLDEYA
jgi:hypothetical protein